MIFVLDIILGGGGQENTLATRRLMQQALIRTQKSLHPKWRY